MAIDLEQLRILKEYKGNESNRVFLVEDRQGRRSVLKIIKVADMAKEILEIEIHRSLDPAYVVELKEFEVTDNYLMMILEFAERGDLFHNLKSFQTLPQADILRFFRGCVEAVAYLHSQGIVHRDLKPENILVTADLRPKLSDFGTSNDRRIISNTFCGTWEYMAPEMFLGLQQTEKVDVWALGVLLFEITHNRTPFRKEELNLMHSVLRKKDIPFRADLDPQIKRLIHRALVFDPMTRPTATDLLNDTLLLPYAVKKTPFIPLVPVSRPDELFNSRLLPNIKKKEPASHREFKKVSAIHPASKPPAVTSLRALSPVHFPRPQVPKNLASAKDANSQKKPEKNQVQIHKFVVPNLPLVSKDQPRKLFVCWVPPVAKDSGSPKQATRRNPRKPNDLTTRSCIWNKYSKVLSRQGSDSNLAPPPPKWFSTENFSPFQRRKPIQASLTSLDHGSPRSKPVKALRFKSSSSQGNFSSQHRSHDEYMF